MTARVCPVHGEYAPSGICRWCEPPKQPEPRKVHPDVPKGSTFCRCGEYAWEPWCPSNEREGVIAGVLHSPAQCFKLDAEPPAAEPGCDCGARPGMAHLSSCALMALRRELRADLERAVPGAEDLDAKLRKTFTLTERTDEAYVWRLEWTGLDAAKILRTYQPEYLARIGFRAIYIPTPADLPIQPPVVLEYQHAALRWERVARRWATKAKFDGHERTVDGTLAFDDRCSECRRTRRLTDAGIPKEWP